MVWTLSPQISRSTTGRTYKSDRTWWLYKNHTVLYLVRSITFSLTARRQCAKFTHTVPKHYGKKSPNFVMVISYACWQASANIIETETFDLSTNRHYFHSGNFGHQKNFSLTLCKHSYYKKVTYHSNYIFSQWYIELAESPHVIDFSSLPYVWAKPYQLNSDTF